MPSTVTSRIDGLTTSVAVKAPIKIMATGPLTLSGEQAISSTYPDGSVVNETVLDGDRVGVNGQADKKLNGIYVCRTTAWERAKDFDGSLDAVYGTLVTDSLPVIWRLITPIPVLFGTSNIEFEVEDGFNPQNMTDLQNRTDPAKGTGLIGFILSALALAVGRSLHSKVAEIEVSIVDFGAEVSPADSSTAFTNALDFLETLPHGGVLTIPEGVWINNNSRFIDSDNILIKGRGARLSTIQRTSAATGYMFFWANSSDTSGGGITGCRLVGVDTTAAGAGLGFGTEVNYANEFVVDDVISERWGQFGCQVINGNNWSITRLRVIDHGLTTGVISSCIGFGVFPRLASSGGYISGVKVNMSAECIANASANTAAVKLQTHQNLRATDIVAIGGRESCVSIDSITGYVRGLIVSPQSGRTGLTCGNNNTAHTFSGQTYEVDGVTILGDSVFGMSMSGLSGGYSLDGVTLRNITGRTCGASYLNNAGFRNCVFENWEFGDIRFAHPVTGTTDPGVTSTKNELRNIRSNGLRGTGACAIQTSESIIRGVGAVKDSAAATVSTTSIYGANNDIVSLHSDGAAANTAFVIEGSSNTVKSHTLRNHTARSYSFSASSNNNTIYGNVKSGTAVLDSGAGNSARQDASVSADKGDAAFVALPYESDSTIIYGTPLTAVRAITLNTTGAYNGLKMKIVRSATATGAFNLNVGTGPLKSLTAAGQWCEVEYNGSAWALSAAGTL